MLGYWVKIKIWFHTPSLFSKITVFWHPSLRIFTSGGFYRDVSVVLITKIQVCQKTCFLKHIKNESIHTISFSKKGQNVGKNDPKMISPKPIFFYMLSLLASKKKNINELFMISGEDCFWCAIFENAYFVQRWSIWNKSWLNMTQKLI